MTSAEQTAKYFEASFELAWRVGVVKVGFYQKLFAELAKGLPDETERQKEILSEAVLRIVNNLDDDFFLFEREAFQSKDRIQRALGDWFGKDEVKRKIAAAVKSTIRNLYPGLEFR